MTESRANDDYGREATPVDRVLREQLASRAAITRRLTVDLPLSHHDFLKRFSIAAECGMSQVVRTLVWILRHDERLAEGLLDTLQGRHGSLRAGGATGGTPPITSDFQSGGQRPRR